jgi:hypothetical protein
MVFLCNFPHSLPITLYTTFMKVYFLFLAIALGAIKASAINYTFTGNGAYVDPTNWAGGVVPGSNGTLYAGNTITIEGNCTVALNCSPIYCTDPNELSVNYGTIIVAAGGSLTLSNPTQFGNAGSIIIYGNFINKTTLEAFNIGTITVYGTYTNNRFIGNQGLITVDGGAVINNGTFNNVFINPGQIIISNGGTITNTPGAILKLGNTTYSMVNISNSGLVSGTPTVNGTFSNAGNISPGNSPGTFTINGDYTSTSASTHTFEVAGTAANQYDILKVSGTAYLNGTLNVSLTGGFTPTTNHDLPIISGTINGSFSSVNIPASYSLVYTSTSVLLRHSIILPVTLVSLTAKKDGSAVRVGWSVENEKQLSRYEVERSEEGNKFVRIGSINASGQRDYFFVDAQPGNKNFYRIKSIDADGKYEYSSVVSYNNGKSAIVLKAFTSGGSNEMVIQHATSGPDSKISVYSTDGRLVLSAVPGISSQQTTINVAQLKMGVYIIAYQNSGGWERVKLIKK